MDDEGHVCTVDRVKDMTNAAGFRVWPAEVERLLYRHPAVKEVAVYGVPDPLKGEVVRAAIVARDGAAPAAVARCPGARRGRCSSACCGCRRGRRSS